MIKENKLSTMGNYNSVFDDVVANHDEVARGQFIRKTYGHVAGALVAFVAIEGLLLSTSFAVDLATAMIGNWWAVLLLFFGATWLSEKLANSSTSLGNQYLGLGLYVLAEAVIFVPLLLMAQGYANSGSLLLQAFTVTTGLFAGLSLVVLTTKKDFNFLGNILAIGGMIAVGTIVAGMIFGFDLGLFFSAFMVVLVSGTILYQTSNMLYRYHTSQYVAASLGLFASFMTLLWYIIQIFLSRD